MTRTERVLVLTIAALLLVWAVGLLPGKAVALFIAMVLAAIVVGRA